MLTNMVTFLLLSPNNPTTFQFSEPIEFFNLGSEKNFYSYKSKDGKILVIKPLAREFDVSMVVISKNKSYQFRLKNTKDLSSSLFVIKSAKKDKFYQLLVRRKTYRILLGHSTIKIENQKKRKIKINGKDYYRNTIVIPKGSALFVNNERIIY